MCWKCEKCGEKFNYYDEVVFLCDGIVVDDEEHGGSGDIDETLCQCCYEDKYFSDLENK